MLIEVVIQAAVIFIVFAVIILSCRELSCWYFKINDHLEAQKKQNALLEKIYSKMISQNAQGDINFLKSSANIDTELTRCPECGRYGFNGSICQDCGWKSSNSASKGEGAFAAFNAAIVKQKNKP